MQKLVAFLTKPGLVAVVVGLFLLSVVKTFSRR